MARAKDPEKRSAILDAAVLEIAENGLSAPTAKIAKRAGVAEGTLFTYFASKDLLLNDLYRELKLEGYRRVNEHFPASAPLKKRLQHIWIMYLGWGMEFPQRRRVSIMLNISGMISEETRVSLQQEQQFVFATMAELDSRASMQNLPKGFGSKTMSALQEAALEFASRQPHRRKQLMEEAFGAYWRMVR